MLHSVSSSYGPRDAAHVVYDPSRDAAGGVSTKADSTAEGLICAFLLLLALIFGGGTRADLFSDLLIQLAAIPAIVFALLRAGTRELVDVQKSWLVLIASIIAVPLIFLLPLPNAIWQWLPGRSEVFAAQTMAGTHGGWSRALTLDTTATMAALRALLPAIALALLAPQLDDRWRRRLLKLVILVAVFSVPLGLAQLNGGANSPLRFYVPTNVHDAVGLFANRNHFAAFMVAALMITAGFLLEDLSSQRSGSFRFRLQPIVYSLIGCVLIFGLAISRSRAGLGLAAVGLLGVAVCGWRVLGPRILPWIMGGAALALLLVFQVGFVWIVDRLGQLFAGDHRWLILSASTKLANEFAWVGVGPGVFPVAYAAFEPISAVGAKIVNHAHNDWLEWWVEAGFLLPLATIAFFWWFRTSSLRLYRALVANLPDQIYRQGVWLAVVVGIVHAAFDYQLRTTTNLCVFVLCCATLVQLPGFRPRQTPSRFRSRAVPALNPPSENA